MTTLCGLWTYSSWNKCRLISKFKHIYFIKYFCPIYNGNIHMEKNLSEKHPIKFHPLIFNVVLIIFKGFRPRAVVRYFKNVNNH